MSYQTEYKKFVLPRLANEWVYGRVFAINGGDLEQQVSTTCVLCQERTFAETKKYVNATIDGTKPMPAIVCSFRAIQSALDDPSSIEGSCETLADAHESAYIHEENLENALKLRIREIRIGKIKK